MQVCKAVDTAIDTYSLPSGWYWDSQTTKVQKYVKIPTDFIKAPQKVQ